MLPRSCLIKQTKVAVQSEPWALCICSDEEGRGQEEGLRDAPVVRCLVWQALSSHVSLDHLVIALRDKTG